MCNCCRDLLVLLVVGALTLCGLLTGLAEEEEKKKAPQKNQYSGKTVKDRQGGMGLIRSRGKNVPKVGQVAPDFTLKTKDGKKTVKLSSFRGKKPVVLVFGSYT